MNRMVAIAITAILLLGILYYYNPLQTQSTTTQQSAELTVTRELPETVSSGGVIGVTLKLNSVGEIHNLVLYEKIPEGFVIPQTNLTELTFNLAYKIDPETGFFAGNWTEFNDTLTYVVEIPDDAEGTYTFQGTYTSEEVNGIITGDQTIMK